MILVDTSIWVRAWRGRLEAFPQLSEIMRSHKTAGHELVHGELLAGDGGGRAGFLADYERLTWGPRLPHQEVAHFARLRRLHGRGAGWVDLHLLAATLVKGWRLWTADAVLAELADDLGIGHRI